MTKCNIDKSRLILYACNELEEKDKAVLEAHFHACPECRIETEDYQGILDKLSSLDSIEPSKQLFIEPPLNRKRNKTISFITYGAIAASFICLAVISFFKLSTSNPHVNPTYNNQQSVTNNQNTTPEDSGIYAWNNDFTDEIAALQESAITFTANIKTTPLTSLDESIEQINNNIQSMVSESAD
jgi:hypothetical protein